MVIICMIYKNFIDQKLFRTLVHFAGEGDFSIVNTPLEAVYNSLIAAARP